MSRRDDIDRIIDEMIVEAVKHERRECARLVRRAADEHKASAREIEDEGNLEDPRNRQEKEQHEWDADTLERLAGEIDKRP